LRCGGGGLDQVMRFLHRHTRPEHLSVIAENPFNIEEVMHEQANTRKSDQKSMGD
jgi:hypothetical protein